MHERTGIDVVATGTPQEAVRGAHVVLCATNSFSPIYSADWVEPGVHISTIQQAELDPDVIRKAQVLVTHYSLGRPAVIDASRGIGQVEKTEGIRQRMRDALTEFEVPNLHDLVLGRVKGRTSPDQVSCFLNYVGLGYQFSERRVNSVESSDAGFYTNDLRASQLNRLHSGSLELRLQPLQRLSVLIDGDMGRADHPIYNER